MVFWSWWQLKFCSGQNWARGVTWPFDYNSEWHLRKPLISTSQITCSAFWCILTRLTQSSRIKAVVTQKQRESADFSQKLETNFSFRARVRISSRTVLQGQFGQKWSMDPDPFRLGWISKWQVFQVRFTLLGRIYFGPTVIAKIQTDRNWGRFREK
jgi:hypothetical protein